MTLPTSWLSSEPGMISLNESGAAFSSVLPVSIDICFEVIDEEPDMPVELVEAICEAIEAEPSEPMVTPFALTSVPSGSRSNTENFTSYVYWMPVEPTYWWISLFWSSRYFLKLVRLFSVIELVRLDACLMLRSSG